MLPDATKQRMLLHTFFFQEDTTLGYNNGNITINVALPIVVHQRDGNISIGDALSQRDAENAMRSCLCCCRCCYAMVSYLLSRKDMVAML